MTTIYHEQGFDEDKYFGIQIDCPNCGGSGYTIEIEAAHHPQCRDDCRFCPVPEYAQIQCWNCNGEGWIITDNKDYQA